jgi:acyl carrier protein
MQTKMSLEGSTKTSIRSAVAEVVRRVAEEQDRRLPPIIDDLPLLESGLDSLCFAIIVARLEDALGVDPLSAAEDARFPVTFGDFIRFYESAAETTLEK